MCSEEGMLMENLRTLVEGRQFKLAYLMFFWWEWGGMSTGRVTWCRWWI